MVPGIGGPDARADPDLIASADAPMTVGQVVEQVAVGQLTVSAHLKILTDAHFVLAQRRGTTRLYQVNRRCVFCFPSAADVVIGKAAVPFTEVICTSTPQEATA